MKIKKEIYEGQEIPKFYGIAYRELNRFVAVAYPIPLNLIVGYSRKLWFKVKVNQGLLNDIRTNGYYEGYYEGLEKGKKEATDKVVRQSKDYFKALGLEIKRVFPKVRNPRQKLKTLFKVIE